MDLSGNNVFLYWVGKEYRLILLLRKLIYLHAKGGAGYNVHLITHENVKDYISDLPACFYDLCPANQADYVRVNVVCKYGGIWLDSDVIVMESFDKLFYHIHTRDGFFVTEDVGLYNGLFGSRPNTEVMRVWKSEIDRVLGAKRHHIAWTEIGNTILMRLRMYSPHLFTNYEIHGGHATMMPLHPLHCAKAMVHSSYDAHNHYERSWQPAVILFNGVYKEIESMPDYRSLRILLNYFINKSIANLGDLARGEDL